MAAWRWWLARAWAAASCVLLAAGTVAVLTRRDATSCVMTYMYPVYHRVHIPAAATTAPRRGPPYQLYLYRNADDVDPSPTPVRLLRCCLCCYL
jgi:hypothetical protein